MKATWGETSDEESEVEDGDNEIQALMAKSDTDSDNDSFEVSAPVLDEGTLLETDSSNVPLEPRQELENSGGTILEAVVSAEEGTGEGTSSDSVPETQNDNPKELFLRPWKHQRSLGTHVASRETMSASSPPHILDIPPRASLPPPNEGILRLLPTSPSVGSPRSSMKTVPMSLSSEEGSDGSPSHSSPKAIKLSSLLADIQIRYTA
ncbi:hypothetical protein HAX54_043017 [Datura stramonium]|uniref:Uncharacterized protein n=1 Tax=Datura stramonium TaxID=4076 RepID=A0ABS8RPH2_DATST|nr:hypothetical protein [Datura stramonium]